MYVHGIQKGFVVSYTRIDVDSITLKVTSINITFINRSGDNAIMPSSSTLENVAQEMKRYGYRIEQDDVSKVFYSMKCMGTGLSSTMGA